jgi:hypothetical protein
MNWFNSMFFFTIVYVLCFLVANGCRVEPK